MSERFSDMERARLVGKQASVEEIRPGERDLLRRLREYPELTAKIERLLAIIENAGGDVEKAAEAERRIIEEMRKMGNEAMHSWAHRQQEKKEAAYDAKPGMNRKEKKPLLVHASRKNRNSGANLHGGAGWTRDSPLFPIGRGSVSRVLTRSATGDGGFRRGSSVCRSFH
jgi:hypothetical protein